MTKGYVGCKVCDEEDESSQFIWKSCLELERKRWEIKGKNYTLGKRILEILPNLVPVAPDTRANSC